MNYNFLPLRVKEIRTQQRNDVSTTVNFQQQAPGSKVLLEGTMTETE